MNTKIVILFLSIISSVFVFDTTVKNPQQKEKPQEKPKEKPVAVKDKTKTTTAIKPDTLQVKELTVSKETDTLFIDPNTKLKFYKKNAHASYYHNKFNGRKTASGKRFDNNKYTAAHKKLPFGTLVKVTNETTGKSVIVEITDRGPFSKAREIDLSRRAFMEITSNKSSGVVIVKIEVIDKPITK